MDKTVEILLVEDNPGDVDLTKEVLRESAVTHRLHVARDGMEGLAFLRQEGKYAGSPSPNLILLDLNLPRKDGRELLKDIKEDSFLKRIPVIVLTSSEAESDIAKSYDLHANCYLCKPSGFDELTQVLNAIENFWLKIAKLPPA